MSSIPERDEEAFRLWTKQTALCSTGRRTDARVLHALIAHESSRKRMQKQALSRSENPVDREGVWLSQAFPPSPSVLRDALSSDRCSGLSGGQAQVT